MTRKRLLVLIIVGACAIDAWSASAASAEAPEFSGSFPNKFAGNFKTAYLKRVGGAVITCNKGTVTGSITGPKAINEVIIIFRECVFGTTPCEDFAIGPIGQGFSSSNVAYIKRLPTPPKVGAALSGAGFGSESQWKFFCGTTQLTVQGSQVASLKPINTSTSTLKLIFAAPKGKPSPKKLEGGPVNVLSSSYTGEPELKESGMQLAATLTLEHTTTLSA